MAYKQIIVFAHEEKDAVELLRHFYPHMQDATIHTVFYGQSNVNMQLTDMSAFVTADGELIDVDKLCWLGIGTTSDSCTDALCVMFRAYLHRTADQSITAFSVAFHI